MFTLLSTAGVPTPVLIVVPLGERIISVMAGPLGAPRKVEKRGSGGGG